MLSYALAIAVAISSFGLFLTAFLMSDIHRKDDFLWSAVGLFYALILWFCARNITGAVLLGQASASLLLISFIWQTLKLRKAVANPEQAVAISNFSVLRAVNGLLDRKKKQPQVTPTSSVNDAEVVTESEIAIPQTTSTEVKSPAGDRQAAQKVNKRGAFGKIFGNKKKAPITNTKPDKVSEEKVVKTKATTPKDKPADVAPPADIASDRQPEQDKVAESLVEKTETEDKPQKTVDIAQQEPANKEVTAVDSPKIVESEEPAATEETKTSQPEAVENQTSEASDVELPTKTTAEISTPIEQSKASSETNIQNNSELETETIKTETNLASEVADSKIVEEVEITKSKTDTDNSEPETETIKTETNSASEVVTSETIEEVEVIKPKSNKSDLDSLETVEVAEVLEALPENSSQKRNSDGSNIIEVTTTDIEEVEAADRATKAKQQEDSQSDL